MSSRYICLKSNFSSMYTVVLTSLSRLRRLNRSSVWNLFFWSGTTRGILNASLGLGIWCSNRPWHMGLNDGGIMLPGPIDPKSFIMSIGRLALATDYNMLQYTMYLSYQCIGFSPVDSAAEITNITIMTTVYYARVNLVIIDFFDNSYV